MEKRYFNTLDFDKLIYFQMPKVLAHGEVYKKLSNDAKLLWVYAFDILKISMQNHGKKDKYGRIQKWKDEKGFYIKLSLDSIKKLMKCGKDKAVKLKKELENFNMIEQKQVGLKQANLIYLLQLDYSEEDIYKVNEFLGQFAEEEAPTEEKTKKAEESPQTLDTPLKSENQTSRSRKIRLQEVGKADTNNNKSINNKSIKEEEEEKSLPSELVKYLVEKGHNENNARMLEKRLIELNVTGYTFEEVEAGIEWAMQKDDVDVPYIYAAKRIETIADPLYKKAQTKKKQKGAVPSAAKQKNKKELDPYTLETYEDYLTWVQEKKQKNPRNKFDIEPEWMFVQKKFERAAKIGMAETKQIELPEAEKIKFGTMKIELLRKIGTSEEDIFESLAIEYDEAVANKCLLLQQV